MERVAIRDIKQGDTYLNGNRDVWTAEADAEQLPSGEFRIRVRHADGGREDRRWSSLSADMQLPMRRADASVRA